MEVLIKFITLKSHGRGDGGMGVKREDDWKKRGEQKRERGRERERERDRKKGERADKRDRKNKTRKGQRDEEIKMQNLGMGSSLL